MTVTYFEILNYASPGDFTQRLFSLGNACRGLATDYVRIGPLHLWKIVSVGLLLRGTSPALYLTIIFAN